MKRLSFVVVLSLSLVACRPKSSSQPQAAPTFADSNDNSNQGVKLETGLITLDKAEQDAAHIVVETVQPKNVAHSITAPGKLVVNEDRTWRVGAIAPGKIDGLSVKVGDSVRAGQVLARIHSHDVHEARAAYREATVELDRARSAVAYATQRRDRGARLLELKAGSRQDLESAESQLVDAQAQVLKAQAEVRKERIHLTDILHVSVEDGGQSGIDKQSSQHDDMGDDIPVLSPASALVFERRATVGSVVNAGDVLFSLTDTTSLWMIAAANETDLSTLRPGQTTEISVRAYPNKTFRGRILKLGEELDPTTRTLEVRILVPNLEGLLKPGMYASAGMEQPQRRQAIFLSDAAIQDIDGVSAVFVRHPGNRFEPRAIKPGQRVNGEPEISEGLRAGETVVVQGGFMLKSQLLKNTIRED
jgi:multidrug efflux pump subunit AcrA (membrane-fusion protein)